jgi:Flp pilus assembly protein TadG
MREFSMMTSKNLTKHLSEGGLRRLKAFRQDEEGSLLIFGLFCFVMMLLLTGVALDLMRFEERRTTLQNTIDRASLAAADLQQTLPPKEVVKDYFRKAGLTPPTDSQIQVFQSSHGDSRRVSVGVSESMPTWFMKMVGIETLSTPAVSTAEESVGKIEISLILDVSGSMAGSRINNLIPAAKSFVDQIFDSAEDDKVSISIIPYSTQVSLSDKLISYFNVTTEQTVSNCIEFEPSMGDFTTTAVSFGSNPGDRKYQRNGNFDPFYRASPPYLRNCDPAADREILPFSSDRTALKTFIGNLQAQGNTSIDLGMKWGAALLDPSMQDVVSNMVSSGDLSSVVDGRPFSYDDGQVLKIIVLMTDGENTTEYKLRNASNSDTSNPNGYNGSFASPIYRNTYYAANNYTLNQYSLYDSSTNKYYAYETSQWLSHPWGDGKHPVTTCSGSGKYKTCTTSDVNDTGYDGVHPKSVQLTWTQVWERMSIYYVADNLIYNAYGSTTTRNQWRPAAVTNPKVDTYVDGAKDAQTLSLCTAAKNHDVRIYTIAFEAPYGGQQLLSSCASSDASHYEVEGLDIQDAFSGIVQSINKLRLTH